MGNQDKSCAHTHAPKTPLHTPTHSWLFVIVTGSWRGGVDTEEKTIMWTEMDGDPVGRMWMSRISVALLKCRWPPVENQYLCDATGQFHVAIFSILRSRDGISYIMSPHVSATSKTGKERTSCLPAVYLQGCPCEPPPPPFPSYLSTVAVKYPEYGRVALVGDVGEHLEAVLHVISPPLYGVHGYVVVLELPRLGELRVQDTETPQPVVLHHLGHFPLHHLHGVPAGLDDGFHLVGVEEIAPQRQADAQQEQSLRPEEKITHDPTQKRQERHCVSYHHTHPNCSLSLEPSFFVLCADHSIRSAEL